MRNDDSDVGVLLRDLQLTFAVASVDGDCDLLMEMYDEVDALDDDKPEKVLVKTWMALNCGKIAHGTSSVDFQAALAALDIMAAAIFPEMAGGRCKPSASAQEKASKLVADVLLFAAWLYQDDPLGFIPARCRWLVHFVL